MKSMNEYWRHEYRRKEVDLYFVVGKTRIGSQILVRKEENNYGKALNFCH